MQNSLASSQDEDKALKELGDVLWYAAVKCYLTGGVLGSEKTIEFSEVYTDEDFIDVTLDLTAEAIHFAEPCRASVYPLLAVVSTLANYLGSSLEEVMQMNIDKLMARYPEGFDSNRSINREE